MITKTDLPIVRGDTCYFDILVTQDADGSAFDLTGCSAWFTVKLSRNAADAAKILQKTVGSGLTVVGSALAGKLRLQLSATDTAALLTRIPYVWDIQIKNSAGDIITPSGLAGKIIVEGDVTRAVT